MDPFIPYLKAVGRGEKLKRDLTFDEAAEAMRLMLSERATPAQMGGFLIAQRVKGESVSEILGFTQAAREFCQLIKPQVEGLLDLALPYDGKVKTLQLGPVIALLVATAGQPVIMHGGRDIPTKYGIGPVELLEALGVPIDLPPERVEQHLETLGIGFLYLPRFAPTWAQLTPLRRQFGLRTALNTVEKFLNPANAPISVSGFFHRNYILRILPVCEHVAPHTFMIQGVEGSIECTPDRANPVYSTQFAGNTLIVKSDGLALSEGGDLTGLADAAAHAQVAQQVLNGQSGPARDAVMLTAGILLFLAQRVPTIAAGVSLAGETIDNGAANNLLKAWQQAAVNQNL